VQLKDAIPLLYTAYSTSMAGFKKIIVHWENGLAIRCHAIKATKGKTRRYREDEHSLKRIVVLIL